MKLAWDKDDPYKLQKDVCMTVYVVIIIKESCTPKCYVYKNKEDAIKLYSYYTNLGKMVSMEEAEVR